MPLLPGSPEALLGLAVALGGTAYVALRRDVPKAYGLAFLIFVLFGLQTFAALFLGGDEIAFQLGFRSNAFLAGEQWWAPVTYMYVHAGLFHFVGNLLILISAGPIVEDRLGAGRFLGVYFLAGLAAVVAHLGMTELLNLVPGWSVAVGASGALFGVLTVLAWHFPREKIPIILYFVIWLPSIAVLGILVAMNLWLMFTQTSVAWYGHFAGFVVGFAAAPLLRPKKGPTVRLGRLPDPDALVPLATSDQLKEILERLRATGGETWDDAAFADAWLDRFFAKARCPGGHPLTRKGLGARCEAGEYEIRFARDA